MTTYYDLTCIGIPLQEGDREYVDKLLENWEEWVEDKDDPCEKGFAVQFQDHTRYEGKECAGVMLVEEDADVLNIDNVVNFLVAFMRDRRPGQVMSFTWCYGVEKSIPDNFGGGACVIDSKENVEYLSVREWIEGHKERLGGKNFIDACRP